MIKASVIKENATFIMDLHTIQPHELIDHEDWWQIYESSFPPEEREPREVLIRGANPELGRVIEAQCDGKTVGIATLSFLKTIQAIFLVYLAVRNDIRGEGIGKYLFKEACNISTGSLAEQGYSPCGVIWEVEMPNETGITPAQQTLRKRRIEFFERLGGELLTMDFQYHQPPLEGGLSAVPLDLMAYRLNGSVLFPDAHEIVKSIYQEKYVAINKIEQKVVDQLL